MAGSYRHVTEADGSFRGFDLIENGGDAAEAIDEMWQMIAYMGAQLTPDDPRRAIHEAHRFGVERPPGNTANDDLMSFDRYWSDE